MENVIQLPPLTRRLHSSAPYISPSSDNNRFSGSLTTAVRIPPHMQKAPCLMATSSVWQVVLETRGFRPVRFRSSLLLVLLLQLTPRLALRKREKATGRVTRVIDRHSMFTHVSSASSFSFLAVPDIQTNDTNADLEIPCLRYAQIGETTQ